MVPEDLNEYYIKGGFMKNLKIAIVGATGLVGETILKILYEENLFWGNEITLYVSRRSAGKEYLIFGRKFRFVELNENEAKKSFDIVFFSAGTDVSLKYAKLFSESGAFVVDNTNAFRREKDVPLVVPEINAHLINENTKIISNPNCSTIELAVVIEKLMFLSDIEKVVVSTYQSVSGAGRRALYDLKNNAKNVFKYGINDEIIAKIGEIQENGASLEENKMMFELSKILNKEIDVSVTAVRVPTSVCHGESVYVKFKNDVNLIDVFATLDHEHIKVSNDMVYLTDVRGTNLTHVFRIRQHKSDELEFFVIADNLRRGAAFNAVLIAKEIIEKFVKRER